jgi:hypothetical protein
LLNQLIESLEDTLPVGGRPLAVVIVVIGLFLVAWILSQIASRVATYFVDRNERRRMGDTKDIETGVISSIRQRETAISLIATSVRYVVFGLAVLLTIVVLSGAQRLQTVIGASFLAIVIGFAAQRFLTDVVAGLLMFFEGWFRIGDTVAIDSLKVQGVVESVSPRSITLRSITGETLHVPNSQVNALRVVPRGFREVEIEFFTSELAAGLALVEQVARIVPVGPTRFLRRPAVTESEALDDDLYRITAHCAVAAGREWLAEDFLATLIKERAPDDLLLVGPIVTYVDDRALQSFTRATAAGRKRRSQEAFPGRRAPRPATPPAVDHGDTPWPPPSL